MLYNEFLYELLAMVYWPICCEPFIHSYTERYPKGFYILKECEEFQLNTRIRIIIHEKMTHTFISDPEEVSKIMVSSTWIKDDILYVMPASSCSYDACIESDHSDNCIIRSANSLEELKDYRVKVFKSWFALLSNPNPNEYPSFLKKTGKNSITSLE